MPCNWSAEIPCGPGPNEADLSREHLCLYSITMRRSCAVPSRILAVRCHRGVQISEWERVSCGWGLPPAVRKFPVKMTTYPEILISTHICIIYRCGKNLEQYQHIIRLDSCIAPGGRG